MLRQADIWVLDRVYQPAADFVWDWTGVNCFGVVRVSTGLYWFMVVVSIVIREGSLWKGCGDVVFVSVFGLAFQMSIVFHENRYKVGFANVVRLTEQPIRILVWILVAMNVPTAVLSGQTLLDVVRYVADVFFVSLYYFSACSVRPRRPRRIVMGLLAIARVPG